MSLRRKVTGALAWAGLVIVIAVPAAELVSSKLLPADDGAKTVTIAPPAPTESKAAEATPEPTPVAEPEAAPETVAARPATSNNDTALDDYLASGRKLPSYLTPSKTGETAPPPAAPAAVAPPVAAPAPVAVTPPPAPAATQPAPSVPAPVTATAPVAEPPPPMPRPVTERPKPPKAAPPVVAEDRTIVTEDDLAGWKSGSLEDYLRQQGLLSREPPASN